jgi:hypothetical protein
MIMPTDPTAALVRHDASPFRAAGPETAGQFDLPEAFATVFDSVAAHAVDPAPPPPAEIRAPDKRPARQEGEAVKEDAESRPSPEGAVIGAASGLGPLIGGQADPGPAMPPPAPTATAIAPANPAERPLPQEGTAVPGARAMPGDPPPPTLTPGAAVAANPPETTAGKGPASLPVLPDAPPRAPAPPAGALPDGAPTRQGSTKGAPSFIPRNMIEPANIASTPPDLMTLPITDAASPAAEPVETPLRAQQSSGHTPPGTAQPAAMARQIVEALGPAPATTAAAQAGSIELSLSPQELGSVRMVFSGGEGALIVQIAAERPETHELLRRNAELLLQDLRDAGHAGVTLHFASGQDRQQHFGETADPAENPRTGDEPRDVVAVPAIASARTPGATGRLDLRL